MPVKKPKSPSKSGSKGKKTTSKKRSSKPAARTSKKKQPSAPPVRTPTFWQSLSIDRRLDVIGVVLALLGLLTLLSLISAVAYALTAPSNPGIVLSGLAVLSGALAIFLLFLGLLSQLIYSTMTRRFDLFRRLAARPVPAESTRAYPEGHVT